MQANTLNLFTITEVELIYRNKLKKADRPIVKTSNDAYNLLIQSWDHNKIELLEEFKVLLLDRNNACMGISHIAQGGVSTCIVDPKIIFSTALKAKASGIILAHNHPSGNLIPSQSDFDLTSKLKAGGKLLEISVLDHLVITDFGYHSMADEGTMPHP
jgi:DNA repair protein RadC